MKQSTVSVFIAASAKFCAAGGSAVDVAALCASMRTTAALRKHEDDGSPAHSIAAPQVKSSCLLRGKVAAATCAADGRMQFLRRARSIHHATEGSSRSALRAAAEDAIPSGAKDGRLQSKRARDALDVDAAERMKHAAKLPLSRAAGTRTKPPPPPQQQQQQHTRNVRGGMVPSSVASRSMTTRRFGNIKTAEQANTRSS